MAASRKMRLSYAHTVLVRMREMNMYTVDDS